MDLTIEIEKYLEYCKSNKRLSEYSIKAYKIDLYQFKKFKKAIALEKDNLIEYIKGLHKKFKPKTVRRKIASLKAFTKYLYRQNIIYVNPFDQIDTTFKEPMLLPKTIPEYIIKNLLIATYQNIKESNTDKALKNAIRNTAIIELLFATGARISEICSLRSPNIDLISGTVCFLGKGAKERIIQLENPEVLSILKRYKECFEINNTSEYFFINNRNSRFSEQSARIMLKRLEEQIHSSIHITPHMFRHSMATYLLEEDVDIRYIQRILGHSSITTTQIYTHVTSAKQKEILKTKHPRNKIHI